MSVEDIKHYNGTSQGAETYRALVTLFADLCGLDFPDMHRGTGRKPRLDLATWYGLEVLNCKSYFRFMDIDRPTQGTNKQLRHVVPQT